MPRKHKRYGCRPDLKDHRDLLYHQSDHFKLFPLPTSIDVSAKLPACWDQGELGSCTGHGSVGGMVYIHSDKMFSRLDAYFNGRVIEGDVDQDAGAQIRDVVSGIANTGLCEESVWPYDITTFATPPDLSTAVMSKVASYFRVCQLSDLKNSLAQGFPVIIGFTVYESFESPAVASSGIVPYPADDEEMLGGHCVLVVGYDDRKQMVFVRNSWGTGWGLQGNFWMPYKFFDKLVSDMWTLRS